MIIMSDSVSCAKPGFVAQGLKSQFKWHFLYIRFMLCFSAKQTIVCSFKINDIRLATDIIVLQSLCALMIRQCFCSS